MKNVVSCVDLLNPIQVFDVVMCFIIISTDLQNCSFTYLLNNYFIITFTPENSFSFDYTPHTPYFRKLYINNKQFKINDNLICADKNTMIEKVAAKSYNIISLIKC